ncbi:MAG: hypothetical protein Q8J97_05645, partial [Flavobacteriaceae bacterium]|nr:hypothetical protein [Flavobacteriaceae bacterium]
SNVNVEIADSNFAMGIDFRSTVAQGHLANISISSTTLSGPITFENFIARLYVMISNTTVTSAGDALTFSDSPFNGTGSSLCIERSTLSGSNYGMLFHSNANVRSEGWAYYYDGVSFVDNATLAIRDSTIAAQGYAVSTYRLIGSGISHLHHYARVANATMLISNTTFASPMASRVDIAGSTQLNVDAPSLQGGIQLIGDGLGRTACMLPAHILTMELLITGIELMTPPSNRTLRIDSLRSLTLEGLVLTDGQQLAVTSSGGAAIALPRLRATNGSGVTISDSHLLSVVIANGVLAGNSYIIMQHSVVGGAVTLSNTPLSGGSVMLLNNVTAAP